MGEIKSFKDLLVWQKAYKLAVFVYKVTEKFPKKEQYGITGQLRRCAVSVPSNIAEGYRRKHKADYIRFLGIAYGSLAELETQWMLSVDFGYMSHENFETGICFIVEVSKMLNSLIFSLENCK